MQVAVKIVNRQCRKSFRNTVKAINWWKDRGGQSTNMELTLLIELNPFQRKVEKYIKSQNKD